MLQRIFVLLAICAFTTGCWDSAEIDQLAIATASGVDISSNEESQTAFKGYLQIAVPSSLGTTSGGSPSTKTGTTDAFVLAEGAGADVGEALDKARTKISRKLIMSHRRVTIVGEEYAKQGVGELLDEITRNPSSRLRTVMLVGYHSTALNILQLPYPMERLPQEAVIGLTHQSSTEEYTIKDFMAEQEIGDPYTLGIEPAEFLEEKHDKGFQLRHIAVFQGDKLVGWLGGEDFDSFLWLRGSMKGKISSVSVPGSSGLVDCKLLKSKTIRRVSWSAGKPQESIQVEAMYDVIKNGTTIDLRNPKSITTVESALSAQMETGMKTVLDKLQHQYQADPVGITADIYKSNPGVWHRMERHWRQEYSQLPVHVEVHVKVRRSGLISSNMKEQSS